MATSYRVSLSDADRLLPQQTSKNLKTSSRKATQARILLKADTSPEGPEWSDTKIAESFEVSPQTVERLHTLQMEDADVFAAHAHAVRSYCRSRLRQRSDLDVEDAVQETFIQWLRRSDRDVNNPEAWLIHAARFVCYRMLTRGPRDILDEDPGRHEREGGADPAVAVADVAWLREVLRRLPAQQREILSRLYLDDWEQSQVAAHLGITVEHLRVLKHRALLKARAIADQIGRGLGGLIPGFVPRGWARFRRALHDAVRRPNTRRTLEQLATYPMAVEAAAATLILLAPTVAAAAGGLGVPWHGDRPAPSLAGSATTASSGGRGVVGGPLSYGGQGMPVKVSWRAVSRRICRAFRPVSRGHARADSEG